ELIMPNYDITPEMMTHTFVVDLETLQPTDPKLWEQRGWNNLPTDQEELVTDYIALACEILHNVGLTPTGVTSPGGFGNPLDFYARCAENAVRRVTGNPTPFLFKRVNRNNGEAVPTPVWYAKPERGEAMGEVIACIADWTGSWTGYGEVDVDKYITSDLQGGRLPEVIDANDPAVMVSHWQGFYGLHNDDRRGFKVFQEIVRRLKARDPFGERTRWRKCSEITNYAIAREMAEVGWQTGLELAREKGPAPIMLDEFEVSVEMLAQRPEMERDGYTVGDKVRGSVLMAKYSRYMQQFPDSLTDAIAQDGVRYSHHTSIAPTGTISLSLGNNASNGIEPSFAHLYSRNVIREKRKTKEKIDVLSYELLAYRQFINPNAAPDSEDHNALPDYFVSADSVSPKQHVDVQAAAQKWVDSSISKTANIPTNFPFEDFKDVYLYAHEQGLKGCTTFRFNPEAFQGVLVKEQDLEDTVYRFTLDNGEVIEVKGNEEVEYDGETHTAANLFDALKEGYYGKF
ncbi:MAG: hypothetical protein QGG64_11395, partial [Candidatus Latescibacteria bacterium]|nr:hypothetical protein [Candidatus Latescibacterota bacterium]